MATGHSQAPRLGGSCHSMPADCCHIYGFSKRSQRLIFKKKKNKKHEVSWYFNYERKFKIFKKFSEVQTKFICGLPTGCLQYGKASSLSWLPGVVSCFRDLWRTLAVQSLNSFNLQGPPGWCLARVANDTVTVPFLKGSGTEVASAGRTSYT